MVRIDAVSAGRMPLRASLSDVCFSQAGRLFAIALLLCSLAPMVAQAAPVTTEDEEYCQQYAANSVVMHKSIASKLPECGLIAPWYSDDFDGHYAWCLSVGHEAAKNELQRKGNETGSCRMCAAAATKLAQAARRMPQACGPAEIQYLPPGPIDNRDANFDECYFKAGDRFTANFQFLEVADAFIKSVNACKGGTGDADGGAGGTAKPDCFSGLRVIESGPGKGKQVKAKFCLNWASTPCKMTGTGIASQSVSKCSPGKSMTVRARYASGGSITWVLKRRADGGLTGTWKHSDGATGFFAMP